jgi:hypothetical protein
MQQQQQQQQAKHDSKSITGINYDSKHFIDQISKQRQSAILS